MKILIIGGSRFVGPLLINKLLGDQHEITVFNRGTLQSTYPKTVRFIKGDRNVAFNLPDHFDVVIDMCAYTGEQTARALRELHFEYFLNFGTVASYKHTTIFPLTEESAIGDWPSFGDYNKGKVECEKELEKSGKRYASFRPVYILGPKNYCDREHFIYSRIKKGETLTIPGDGQALAQFVFVDEVVEAIATLVQHKPTGAFNLTGDQIISLVGLVEEMGKIVGKKPNIALNPNAAGANFREEDFPFDNESMVVSNEKIKRTFNFKFKSIVDGLTQDYNAYYKKNS